MVTSRSSTGAPEAALRVSWELASATPSVAVAGHVPASRDRDRTSRPVWLRGFAAHGHIVGPRGYEGE